ncbi:hypothetical protein ANCCAN_00214 [Ancylostoma caninum]|uniref:Uncharacterized protein n=1 Tax=Ancylostoma caninum TaxID=29170 RepID=A0A368HE75_ANCCA|nr:hypothetical protein ANCCAN_00214 [Ancylostoma caninum]
MSGDVETDNWESTVSQMVKKMLDTVVVVDARASFGDGPFLRMGDLRRTREVVKRRRHSSFDGERNESNISDFFHAIENILENFVEEVLSEERFRNDVSSFAAQGVKSRRFYSVIVV